MNKMIYYPANSDTLSKQALMSIPKKISSWLAFMGKGDITRISNLYWFIEPSEKNNSDFFISVDEDEHGGSVSIYWTTDFEYIGGTEPWMVDIAKNLDKFVLLEKRIYDIVERYFDEVSSERVYELKNELFGEEDPKADSDDD